MSKSLNPEVRALKRAYKTLNFWFKVFNGTDHMNDVQDRRDYQSALLAVKTNYKKLKKEN